MWIAVKMDQTDGNKKHTFNRFIIETHLDRVNGGNASALESLKNSLKEAGWTVPDLVNNMRNSATTIKIANQIKTPIGTNQKGKPFTTVHGFSPLLLKVGKSNDDKLNSKGVKKALKEAVEHLGLNLANNLLTIIVNEKTVSDCICELASAMKNSMFGKEENENKRQYQSQLGSVCPRSLSFIFQ